MKLGVQGEDYNKKKTKTTSGHISVFLKTERSTFIFWIMERLQLALNLKPQEDVFQEISEDRKWSCPMTTSQGPQPPRELIIAELSRNTKFTEVPKCLCLRTSFTNTPSGTCDYLTNAHILQIQPNA